MNFLTLRYEEITFHSFHDNSRETKENKSENEQMKNQKGY